MDTAQQQETKPCGYILLIEDDDFLRGVLTKSMRDAGFDVSSASNTQEGFGFLHKRTPDIVLLDLMLPGMNGFDFIQTLKERNELVFPVLVLSNLGSHEDIDLVKKMGAVDLLVKANVTPGQIIERIQEILEKKNS